MSEIIEQYIERYNPLTRTDREQALREILQELTLIGLWRAKFFEHAAFYGGTALRILYGLDRFSEDMDFSLRVPDEKFSLLKYNQAIVDELAAFGFEVSVENKCKTTNSAIESAFIKANTIKQLLVIKVPGKVIHVHPRQVIKIKMEVDTNPPSGFTTEAKRLLLPIPFSVLTYSQQDLFAGKIHALLCRKWQHRIKGRDWYDYYWYVSRNITVNLVHLQKRLVQSNHWNNAEPLSHDSLV